MFLVLISFGSLVQFYTELLWFGEVELTGVFWTIFYTQVGVGVVAGLGAALIILANLEVARRSAPRYRLAAAPTTDIAEQYRSMFRPHATWLNIAAAAVVGLLTGLSTSTAWDRVLLWRNARPFGVQDPEFGRDVAFFTFEIPFQRTILSWAFGVLVVSIFLAAAAHLLSGSIEPEPNRVRVANVVKVHLSVLLGVFALLKAWSYRLDQFELVYSTRGPVEGATYTDVNAQLPALRLLVIIAVVAAVILFVNLRFRGWLLPGAAVAIWAFASLVLGALVPAAVQRFSVLPAESEREAPFIERNIEMTRSAFGLDRFQVRSFPAEEDPSPEVIEENRGTIDNLRIWDPRVLEPTYQRLQAIRPYYAFQDVDVTRYEIDGRLTQVMASAREVDPSGLSPDAQNWVNLRLTYTHGYGVVANPANSLTPEGQPEFVVRDLPPRGVDEVLPEEGRGGIYYGENVSEYVVANTDQPEIEYPIADDELQTTHYDGEGGIEVANILRRAAFAWRFRDTNMLISGFITPESRILMRRNIVERAEAVAPFLTYDRDPYIVVADDRLYWILDAYTTSDRYPYAESLRLEQIFGPEQAGNINYMRNSVKVIVNAYDGTMDFYLMEPDDAIAATYQAAFPDLFTAEEEMPDGLRAHIRYPEDLFMVQAWQYRVYHMLEPQRVYQQDDVWDIPRDPVHSTEAARVMLEPYYVVMKVPGEEREEFVLMLPFTPKDRPILNGWMAARMDGEAYGEVVAFSFPRGTSIDGPETIAARIDQNDAISQQFTLWSRAGSSVVQGGLFVIPIGNSLIYVQPVYLQAERAALAIPELRRVIVVIDDRIGFESTVEASLEAAMAGREIAVDPTDPEDLPPVTEEPDATPGPGDEDVAQMLERASDHFRRADEALRRGDLAEYQRQNEEGRSAVEEARQRTSGA